MTKKDFDEEKLFETEETITIPDFVEYKTTETTKTESDSSSVDMSIFKMDDDELYDDSDLDDELTDNHKKGGSKTTLILCLLAIGLLLLTSVFAVMYALRQRNAYIDANTKYQQLQANQQTYQNQLAEKDALIESLNKQIEELQANPAANGLTYEIVDGPISFRKTASVDGESTSYNGSNYANNGERYTVLEIIEDQVDKGRKWAKLSDNVYFCIGYLDSVWAKAVE